ncbi:ParA family protein [Streptomyces sp. NPDC098077]|uniref:ParA family protein n=1 Tax=Streptomyces sp. NPDC098077 TaxID=3366093 RepID=UPI00380E1980
MSLTVLEPLPKLAHAQEIVRQWAPEGPYPGLRPQILVPEHIPVVPPAFTGKRTYVIFNQKGGAGKTTSSIELACAFVAMGYTVRLIDGDPQNAGLTAIMPPILGDDVPAEIEQRITLKQVMYNKAGLDNATYRTRYENLYLVPSYADCGIVELDGRIQQEARLRLAIAKSAAPVDIEILDCPGSLGKLSSYAVAAADEMLVPLQVSGVDEYSLPETLETVRAAQEAHPGLTVRAVMLTAWHRIDYTRDLALTVREQYPESIIMPLRRSKNGAIAAKKNQPIREVDPAGTTASDFEQFARLLLPPKELSK